MPLIVPARAGKSPSGEPGLGGAWIRAGLPHLPANLKFLNLTGTQVTDAGLVSISRLTKLEHVYLGNAPITDAGLAHLERPPNLKTLAIMNTQVTDDGAAKLKRKLPTLMIHR